MKRISSKSALVSILLASAIPARGQTQTSRQAEPMSAQFLEQRIRDELESEGIVLSSHNLGLRVEQLAAKWLVSLFDLTTGHVENSTKIDQLPADREAAIAVMTNIVANLEARVLDRRQLPKPQPLQTSLPPPVVPPRTEPAPSEGRDERLQLQTAELHFKQQSLHFGAIYEFNNDRHGTLDARRQWAVFRGNPSRALAPLEFYRTIGRDDLAQAYFDRRFAMILGYATGGIALVSLGMLILISLDRDPSCGDHPTTINNNCPSIANIRMLSLLIAASASTSAIGITVGTYFYYHPHPIDENDAKALADAYNQRLRRRLGLPVSIHQPMIQDLMLMPYARAQDGGFILEARF